MKIFLLLSATFCTILASPTTYRDMDIMSNEFIDHINNIQSTWKAGKNFDENTSEETIKRLASTIKDGKKFNFPIKKHTITDPLPDEFDARTNWPNCPTIGEIGDQANCSAGWAFGAVETISDRICIHSEGKSIVRISAQDLISCCTDCGYGCLGGYPAVAWQYWTDVGIVTGGAYGTTDTCIPYKKEPCEHHVNGTRKSCERENTRTPACETQCIPEYSGSYQEDHHYAKEVYGIEVDEEAIKQDIFKNGPVKADFSLYGDFFQYKTGVYKQVSGQYYGTHSVKLFGWGVEDGTKFWWAANSWNTDWGDQGFFKILRGVNEMDIETNIIAGIPKL